MIAGNKFSPEREQYSISHLTSALAHVSKGSAHVSHKVIAASRVTVNSQPHKTWTVFTTCLFKTMCIPGGAAPDSPSSPWISHPEPEASLWSLPGGGMRPLSWMRLLWSWCADHPSRGQMQIQVTWLLENFVADSFVFWVSFWKYKSHDPLKTLLPTPLFLSHMTPWKLCRWLLCFLSIILKVQVTWLLENFVADSFVF